ncbi:hypothetical protein N483_26040 [Pseudoalteromonas luteoviolacea NCIMB 1944]|nr:hypothetical protein N483_26040 [Pseudoalteromonas luteoviolacea NCIMB 1944]
MQLSEFFLINKLWMHLIVKKSTVLAHPCIAKGYFSSWLNVSLNIVNSSYMWGVIFYFYKGGQ